MNLEVGFEVYWNDPDEHVCSGYGTIVKIKGDIYCLKMDNGEEVEAFKYELSQMRDCMFIIITFIASVLVVLATGIYIETLQDLIMKYKTPENIEQLARDSVDSWDDKCLYQFAVDMVTENFENCDEEEFKSQWHNHYGEDA